MAKKNTKKKKITRQSKTRKVEIPNQYILPLKEIHSLPRDQTFNLLDIGAGVRDIKKFLPSNIKYVSLDCITPGGIKHNIILDLDKGSDGEGHIPIKSDSFDIVLCLETLEHLQNPQRTMEEILRITTDDAWVFLSMPNEYNFWLRLQYLFGMKDKMKEPFQIVNKHLHIHLPRVKDIKRFFGNYLNLDETYYGWNSYRAPKIFNKILSKLSRIWPSMFTRMIVIKGTKFTTP